MSSAERRLAEVMPTPPPAPPAQRLVEPVVIEGGFAYVSGQVAFVGDGAPLKGKVGADVTVEQAAEEAGKAAANGLHVLARELGSLDSVARIIKVTVFVNAVEDLVDQPAVGNGASQVLVEVLGDRGRHARSAVGMASLPLGVPVEVELVAKVAIG